MGRDRLLLPVRLGAHATAGARACSRCARVQAHGASRMGCVSAALGGLQPPRCAARRGPLLYNGHDRPGIAFSAPQTLRCAVGSAPAGCSQFAPAELCDRPKQRRTAVGPQNFIFVSLNRFGSLINVTITITRKFFTILLSVIVYGHHVRAVPCRAHLFACADATAERAVVTLQQHWTDSATGERNAVGNGCDGLRRHPIA